MRYERNASAMSEGDLLQPDGFEEDLKHAAKVLYYRWEFARGLAGLDTLYWPADRCYVRGDRRVRLPNRLLNRRTFLSPIGTPTYLDDLRECLAGDDADTRFLRECVAQDISQACLFPADHPASDMAQTRPDAFFPHPDSLGDRLVEYFSQLFRLQHYLLTELHVKPGSVLPVWLISDGDSHGSLPVIGTLPVRRRIVDALTAFLLWHLGYSPHYYKNPALPGEKNNPDYLDRCLEYGWMGLWLYRLSEEYEHIPEVMDAGFPTLAELKKFLPELRRAMKDEMDRTIDACDDYRNLPVSDSEFLADVFTQHGVPSSPRDSDAPDVFDSMRTAANAPQPRKMGLKAIQEGMKLFVNWRELW